MRPGGKWNVCIVYGCLRFSCVGVNTRLELVERVSFGGEIEINKCRMEVAGVLLR